MKLEPTESAAEIPENVREAIMAASDAYREARLVLEPVKAWMDGTLGSLDMEGGLASSRMFAEEALLECIIEGEHPKELIECLSKAMEPSGR